MTCVVALDSGVGELLWSGTLLVGLVRGGRGCVIGGRRGHECGECPNRWQWWHRFWFDWSKTFMSPNGDEMDEGSDWFSFKSMVKWKPPVRTPPTPVWKDWFDILPYGERSVVRSSLSR